MLFPVRAFLLTDAMVPCTVAGLPWAVIVTRMPGRTSGPNAGLSWPLMDGLPSDSVTSESLTTLPTWPPSLTTWAGSRGTNMISDSGTSEPRCRFEAAGAAGAV